MAEVVFKEKTPLEKIKDANRPYRPQCANKDLATRIMEQAKQVRLFYGETLDRCTLY